MISHQQHVKFPHEPLTVALLPFHMLVCSAAPVQDWLQEGNQHLKNTTKSQKPLGILFFFFFFYPEEVVNSLNRVQMADEPPQVNDHIILSEQAGRVSSAGQDLISARRQPASSLNGVLVLTRQIRHLILRGGSECDVTNQPENCVQAIKTSSIYLDSWNHQCSFVLLWLLREGNILQIIIKISVSLCVSFLVLSLIW